MAILKRPNIKVLTCLTVIVMATQPVCAQELAANYPPPFMEDGVERLPAVAERIAPDDELHPKPLSIADLETLADRDTKQKFDFKSSSPVEQMYSDRAEEELELFGYDLFDQSEKPSKNIPAGSVQDDYILSNGDKLELIIRGQENARRIYEINSQGQLVTDNLSTITSSNRTLGDVRKILEEEAARLHNVEIALSLTSPRQIDVLVIGDVEKPGRKTLTAFHSVLDALSEAEGIKKTGSLRRIKLVRDGKSQFIDLYGVMMQGTSTADKNLRDGDRIIVPPVGPTVAISGAVKRPAIYEIRKGENLSTLEMLGMAGGVLAPGSNRFMRMALNSDGQETVEDVSEPSKKIFGDGGLLTVAQAKEKRSSNVELSGHTRDPGQHDLKKAKTLSELIKSEQVFGDSLYPLIGVIERRDSKSLTKTLEEFSPRQVLQKNHDMNLQEGDVVHLFSMEQIRTLGQNVSKEPLLKTVAYKQGVEEQRWHDRFVP